MPFNEGMGRTTEELTGTFHYGNLGLDPGLINSVRDRLGGQQGLGGMYDKAIAEQQLLKGRLGFIYDNFQKDQTGRIVNDLANQATEATVGLQGRGISQQLGNEAAFGAMNRNIGESTGLLLDKLIPQRIDSLTGIANNITDYQSAKGGLMTGLLGSIFSGAGQKAMQPRFTEEVKAWQANGLPVDNSGSGGPNLGEGLYFGAGGGGSMFAPSRPAGGNAVSGSAVGKIAQSVIL